MDENLKRAITIMESWDCDEQQIKRLLGIRFPRTLEMYTEENQGVTSLMQTRMNCIITIDSVLQKTFTGQLSHLRNEFVNRRNDDFVFRNQTPLQFISKGVKNLQKASEHLLILSEKRDKQD